MLDGIHGRVDGFTNIGLARLTDQIGPTRGRWYIEGILRGVFVFIFRVGADKFTFAGGELRIFVPIFGAPLRFIYSSNLDPRPLDRFESFQFSIGATF